MNWWTYENNKLNDELVVSFERKCDYQYPISFKQIVVEFDGGSPENDVYDTKETKGRVFNNLLSFNPAKKTSVWSLLEKKTEEKFEWCVEGLSWRFIPFARDPFGNFICFDRTNDHIVFWDHETTAIEEVADSFTEFIDSLYAFDEEGFFAKYMK